MDLSNNKEQLLNNFLTRDEFICYSLDKPPELVDKFNQLFTQHPGMKEIAAEAEAIISGTADSRGLPESEKDALKKRIFSSLGLH